MRNGIPIVASLLILGGSAPAPGQAAGSQLTGTWNASIQADDGSRQGFARFDLRIDGRNVTGLITGPQLTPGDVTGTFNPQTGDLVFTVALQGTGTKLEFRGSITNDTLKVSTNDGNKTLVLRATRGTPLDSAAAAAQTYFTQVSRWVTAAANLVPADKYGYKPVASVRTFGQMIGHIIDGSEYYCGRAAGRNVEWADSNEKGLADKSTLLSRLEQAVAACDAVYAASGSIAPLVENISHTNLHYGNLVTYIRMLGLVPPSS
jgi:hypothetical protein